MTPRGQFAFTALLALCLAVAVAATFGAISFSHDEDALRLDELLRGEPVPTGPERSLDEHMGWIFEIFGGQRRWTDEALEERFTGGFNESFDAATLNAGLDVMFADFGEVRFHRITNRSDDTIRALAVARDGTPVTIWLALDEAHQIESLTLDEVPASPRLPGWGATLVVAATWLFLASAIVAARLEVMGQAWLLLLGSPIVAAWILRLSDDAVPYTLGRTVPVAILPLSALLLVERVRRRPPCSVLPAASVGAVLAASTPWLMDATTIGHPDVLLGGAAAETWYRVSSVLSGGLAGAAFVIVVGAASVGWSRLGSRHRTTAAGTALLGGVFAVVGIGSAVDHAIGDGGWAHGPLAAMWWAALCVLPALVLFDLLTSTWSHSEITRLVIDLESDGAELGEAIAAALGDPSLELLTSDDGTVLVDSSGAIVGPEPLDDTRMSTEIRSGARLVGALRHDAALRYDPERLHAVAAAAGLALEVERLNRQVVAQLDEVNASRARIVQASDTARRRLERDLHDGAQQRLVALGVHLQRSRRLAQSNRYDELDELLERTIVEVRETIDDIRAVSRGAQPPLLAERGLGIAVDALAERTPLPVDIDVQVDRLPPPVESTAYFVIAEALTNTAKHAHAHAAAVRVLETDGGLIIRVTDDGRGGAHVSSGSGLEGLHDRVDAAGGRLDVHSGPSGTRLEVTLPCA